MRKDSAFIVVVRVSAVLMQHKRQTDPEERTFQMRPIPTQTTSASDIPDQFVWIYLSYMPYVMSCFQTYSVDVQQAEDLTQEVFIKVFLHREQLPYGIPQGQIAKRLHMHAGTLRTRLYRMHQKLQAALMDNF